MKKIVKIGAVVILCLWALSMCGGGKDKKSKSIDVDTTAVETESESYSSTTQTVKKWHYTSEKDEMRGSVDTWEYIESDNAVELDFPYEGGSKLRLTVRNMKKYGTDVLVEITKGQITGSEYSGTNYVTFKFDDGGLQKYYFNESTNGDNSCVFIKKKSDIISKFKTAKKIMVEVPIYDAGNQQFTFTIDEPYQGK